MTLWDDLFNSYAAARVERNTDAMNQAVLEACHLLPAATPVDLDILSAALEDENRKWFVAALFRQSPVPDGLLNSMLRAAVYEINPSFNKQFVQPCIASFGHRIVNEALLEVVETGTDHEKAGAVNALYWAGISLRFKGSPTKYTFETATPESRASYLELKDVWDRKRRLLLQQFVSNPNVHVRRSIIPSLQLDESAYPDELKPLVARAIEIARNHSDDYIRHRVEVQLGNERLLKPLPNRGSAQ